MNRKLFPFIVLMTIVLWTGIIFASGRVYDLALFAMTVSSFVNPDDGKMSVLQQTEVEASHEEKAKLGTDAGRQTRLQVENKKPGKEAGDKEGYVAEITENPSKTTGISGAGDSDIQTKTQKVLHPEDVNLPEDVKKMEERVSIPDRVRVLGIVLSKLKPEDIKRLTELGKNGITDSERELAKEILKSRITAKEKDILKEIYSKYSD